jgi:2-aminoadipate transaminase
MNNESLFTDTIRAMPEKWPFAENVMKLSTSIIREILKISSKPGVISLAGGYPSPDMFPLEDLKKAACDAIDEFQSSSVQYSFSMGIPQLREVIAERETKLGSPTKMENILITSGSQQGIELCARALINPGDYIITEYPTYVGALQAFNFYQAKYAGIEMDDDGMLVDKVEAAIKKYNPKLIYTISTFQNPTGITMSKERKQALIDVAIKYGIPIVDDNPYGEIRFVGEHVPTMKEIGGDAVISLGTFSKIIAPGLRIAWMNCSDKIISIFEKVKQGADLHSNTFTQYMIYKYLSAGKLEPHIDDVIKSYGEKRNLMLKEMETHFPAELSWTKPEGGLFLWGELPEPMSASKLIDKAVEEKVTYVYGHPFFPDGKGDNTFRLNFSNATLEMISTAIQRLGKVFKNNLPR